MSVEDKDFRPALRAVMKGVLAIVALCILRSMASCLPQTRHFFLGLTLAQFTLTVISVVILFTLSKLYHPVELVLSFYMDIFVRAGAHTGAADRDARLRHSAVVARDLTRFIFLIAIYEFAMPIIGIVSYELFHRDGFLIFANIVFGLMVIGMLVLMWRNSQPLTNIATDHFADSIADKSAGAADYPKCPSCDAQNDKNANFCASCGVRMHEEESKIRKNKIVCAKCGTASMPYANFCYRCGADLHPPAVDPDKK